MIASLTFIVYLTTIINGGPPNFLRIPVKSFKDGDSILRNRYMTGINHFILPNAEPHITTSNFISSGEYDQLPGSWEIRANYNGDDVYANATFMPVSDEMVFNELISETALEQCNKCKNNCDTICEYMYLFR